MKAKHLTKQQFINLLRLALIYKQQPIDSSPNYLVEKYERFIGDPKLISNEDNQGLHPVLDQLVPVYLDYWEIEFTHPLTTNNEETDRTD